ncbi:MAG: cobalt-precorrin-5B (C(1))-methyltransferase CbiD [Geobacteraceae bacterium]|nr:cobalt-precorrin-5B (C(1))-methyltransferase CbiD [Geobacteraceae bacterium]
MTKTLRYGYTTGACATAAARGAVLMLRDQHLLEEVEIILPTGDIARFRLHGQHFASDNARCFVVKDAGDDPDVTNGAEIHAAVTLAESSGDEPVIIRGGTGIGRVTKPGLAVPPGEWAINPVPRKLIAEAVNEIFSLHCPLLTAHSAPRIPEVTISIPNGAELAKKTLNERLGIIGGLSILGTTGIVKPISGKAWTDTIDVAIDVAVACGCKSLVLSTGRTSEAAAQRHLATGFLADGRPGPEEMAKKGYRKLLRGISAESYIMMGDHVGHALRACRQRGIRNVILAAQFAKLLKIACGHEQTHVSCSRLELDRLREWLTESPRTLRFAPFVRQANTAREVFETTDRAAAIISLVAARAIRFAEQVAPGLKVKVLLAGYGGEMVYFR